MPEPKFSLKQEVYWVTENETQKQLHVGNVGNIVRTGDEFSYTVRDIFNQPHTVDEGDLKDSREEAAEIFNQIEEV